MLKTIHTMKILSNIQLNTVRGIIRSSAFLEEGIAAAIAKHGLPAATAHGTGDVFVARLHDPVLDRTIEHSFRAVPIGDELEERNLIPADGPPN